MSSSRLYMQRKKLKPSQLPLRPSFEMGALSTHDRPHVPLPELTEEPHRVYVPPAPPPDVAFVWDDTCWDTCKVWE